MNEFHHKCTTEDNIEDRQGEIEDIRAHAQAVLDHLECAEGCETPKDFDININEALDSARTLIEQLKELRAS